MGLSKVLRSRQFDEPTVYAQADQPWWPLPSALGFSIDTVGRKNA